jgi:hypothetical protein
LLWRQINKSHDRKLGFFAAAAATAAPVFHRLSGIKSAEAFFAVPAGK